LQLIPVVRVQAGTGSGYDGHLQLIPIVRVQAGTGQAVTASRRVAHLTIISNPTCYMPSTQQVSGWSGAAALHAAQNGKSAVVYSGMMDCFAKTVREEGLSALFKVGMGAGHGFWEVWHLVTFL